MKKTALEWFAQLPEPIRSQAVANWESGTSVSCDRIVESVGDALMHGFRWASAPESRVDTNYWSKIYRRAEAGEFDQPEPNLHGWIAVADRLPTAEDADEFGNVLIYRSDTLKTQQDSCKSIIKWNILKHSNTDSTFWQPIPKLPEVKGGENA